MQAVTYPFRFDIHGRLAVATTFPEVVRAQLIDVLMTNFLERVMRPTYGADLRSSLFEATDALVRSDAVGLVTNRIQQWAPKVTIQSLDFSEDVTRPGHLSVNVSYRAGLFAETQQLTLPVPRFLTEESAI